MIVLHGTCIKEEFLLWAETALSDETNRSGEENAEARPQRTDAALHSERRAQTISLPGLHPFASTYSLLRDALAASPAGLQLARKQNAQTQILLPSFDSVPLASTPLIGRAVEELDEPDLKRVQFQKWVIPAVRLNYDQVIALLCHCIDQDQLASGVLVGHDLQFWSLVMRFAGNLVSKQHFLPGLRVTARGGEACWEPAFLGDDGDRLVRLSKGMPEICLADSSLEHCEDFDSAARVVLVKFIGRIVDRLVRNSLTGMRLPATVERISSTESSQLHARWMSALIGEDSSLSADMEELSSLLDQISEWRRPVDVASDSPYRLCFRLEAPRELNSEWKTQGANTSAGAKKVITQIGTFQQLQIGLPQAESNIKKNDGGWYVRFLLQSLKDSDQVLPVETVLSPAFDDLQLLRGGSVSAREYLFRSLGQAVRLCPEIAESFNEEQPVGIKLDINAAYDFLAHKAPVLKNAGFSIQLPAWWTERNQQISLSINIRSGGRLVSLDELAQFDWQVALGGEPLSEDELETLTKLRLPLVCINGKWTELNTDQLDAVLTFVRKNQNASASGRDLVRMALGDVRLPEASQFGGVNGNNHVSETLSSLRRQSGFREVAAPKNFRGQLRPYQIRGLSWLEFLRNTGFGACLADDMGLGKTVQTLAFIQRMREQQAPGSQKPVLLVCPTSLLGNWLREVERFTPDLNVLLHHGNDRARGEDLEALVSKSALVLTTYTLLQREIDDLSKIDWDTVVLDEAQNIKNPQAQQTRAAFALKAKFRLALTGTPVENNVSDLWSLMHFLNPGFLGRQADFYERFFVPIQVFQDAEKMAQLKKLTAPFILRRLKTDKSIMPELPDKFERLTTCTLTKEQASLYAAAVRDAAAVIDTASGMKRKSLVLTTLLRLKQICDHPALILPDRTAIGGRSGKLKALTEMISGIVARGERALVFTQFKDMGEIIQQHLQDTFGAEVLFLHGGTDRSKREKMVQRFQSDDDNAPSVFVLCLKAGGTGLNLTKATHVFHFDRWWNPAVEDQATDRAFRIGQEHEVQVHKLVCAGTLEERIDEIIDSKKNLADTMIGAGENVLTEMSTKQLCEVLALRNTALVES